MKTQFEGAVITEQGVTFAVVSVHSLVFQNASDATKIIKSLIPCFTGIPVVLMAKNPQDTPVYFGRPDLIKLLENVNIQEAPWEQMTADFILTRPDNLDD